MSDYPLVPYRSGEIVPYGEEEPIEGDFRELSDEEVIHLWINLPGEPSDEEPVPDWFGGTEAAPPPPPGVTQTREPRESLRDWWKRQRDERERKRWAGREEEHKRLMEEISRRGLELKLEELKGKRREERAKGRRKWGKVGKAVVQATVPGKPHPRWYIPKAMPEYYVPGGRVRKLTDPTGAPAGYMHTPHLHSLQRAGAPPPTAAVKAPFRDVERFEGLGTAMGRLRELERFPSVDQAVYAEIHANGDIDTPSHVRREVGQLGFSRSEIDIALKRLREAGLVTPSGRVHEGETELMIVGGQ